MCDERDDRRQEILAYCEGDLGTAFDVAREAGAGEEIPTGHDDAVGFQIVPLDGGFRIAFAKL